MNDEPDYLITIEIMRRDGETWARVLLDGNDVTDGVTEKALLHRAMHRSETTEGD